MKHLFNTIIALAMVCPFLGFAQTAPQKMNYQAVARTATGTVIADQEIGLRIAIVSSDDMDRPVFAEEHSVKTNKLGVINIQIGDGEELEGSMQNIDWGSAAHYLKIFLDADNTGLFEEMGTSQLLTVPYAFYAERSGSSENSERGGPHQLDTEREFWHRC
jgi:hypothetical protein